MSEIFTDEQREEIRRLAEDIALSKTPRQFRKEKVSDEIPLDGEALRWDADRGKWVPGGAVTPPTIISTASPFCLGTELAAVEGSPVSSQTYAGNGALYAYPFRLNVSVTIVEMFCVNGAAVSGNLELAILNADGSIVVQTGSTAQSGTNSIQVIDITDTTLSAGQYFLAISVDNTTATFQAWSLTVDGVCRALGVQTDASGFPISAPTLVAAGIAVDEIVLIGAFTDTSQ